MLGSFARFIEAPVYDDLIARLKSQTEKLIIGDPTDRSVYLGPVINEGSYKEFQGYCAEITAGGGHFLTGGQVRTGGMFDKGWFCEPTLAVDLPLDHRLWKHEMFLPITTISKVKNLDEAMQHANEVNYGLTAGFYGSEEETEWFFDHIEFWRGICQPSTGSNHRSLAGVPAIRRMESLRLQRQEFRRTVLPAALYARTDPDTIR